MNKSRVRYKLALLLLVLTFGSCASPSPTSDNTQLFTVSPTTIAESLPPTQTSIASPEPTLTPTPAPTATTAPPTPTAIPTIAGPADTLVLYATHVDMRTSPNRPADVAPYEDYWGLRTVPSLAFLDPTVFDLFYGATKFSSEGMGRFFQEVSPQLSPDGRYLLLPGLAAYPPAGVEGTGLWLIDLVEGTSRELLPDGKIATWSPTSDAITYVTGDTLYSLSIAEGAEPQPLFQHPDLWAPYAKWSPDGQWIAALTSSLEGTDEYETGYAATYWLVPTNGDPARELSTQAAGAIEYSASEMSWSPDSQFLLVRNRVFDLEGKQMSTDYPGRVYWLPNDSRLLATSSDGMHIVTIAGEEIARINDYQYDSSEHTWAFSHDGRRLAYSLPRTEGATVAVYDLERDESQVIGAISGADFVGIESIGMMRWSADDSRPILSVYRVDKSHYEIWTLEAQPGGAAELLLENAELVEAVPYP